MNGKSFADKLSYALLGIYIAVVSWILLFKLGVHFSYMEKRSVNLVPFPGLLGSQEGADMPEIIMTVIIFVPLGIYTGVLFANWSFARKLLLFFSVSLLFELLQYIFRIGAFDVTDIITNTSGGLFGLAMLPVIRKFFPNDTGLQKFVNITGVIATLLVILLLVTLKMGALPVKYE